MRAKFARLAGIALSISTCIGVPGARAVAGDVFIAFGACDEYRVSQVVAARPDGSNPRMLTRGPDPSWFPAWSPDGSRLLFVHELQSVPHLWMMNADGSDARALVAGGPSMAGSWSPDASHIAYAQADRPGSGFKIWIARADGGPSRRLTDAADPAIDENVPRWSPDGSHIAFTSNRRERRYEIWLAEVQSGAARPLTQAFFHPDLMANIEQKVPAWSPDGSTIAYWQGVEGNDPRPGLPREVWLMQAQGTGHRGLTQGDDPVWSPDGAFVIHSNIFGAQPALAAIRPDGSDAHILFPVNVCRPLQSSVKVAR